MECLIFWPQCPVQKLEVLLSCEERVLARHPNTGDDVVLDETAEGFAGCGDKILIIGVCDEHGLRSRDLVLREVNVHLYFFGSGESTRVRNYIRTVTIEVG